MNDKQQAIPQANFDSERELFLKTAGGGQSRHTFLTYRNALAYFQRYLEETRAWIPSQPIAELRPEMFQEFPTWLLRQRYQRSEQSAPAPLAESSRALYLLAVSRFLRFLVIRKQLPHFDYAEYNRIKEELSKATNVKARPIAQKVPATEIVAALVEAAKTPPQVNEGLPAATRRRLWLVWQRNLAVILALKSSGMRVGELVKLKRADLDEARQGAWVTGKGRQTRFVAFDEEAWTAIQAYLNSRQDEALLLKIAQHPLFCRHDRGAGANRRLPLTVRSVQQLFKQLSEQADLARRFNLSPHSLRHYFANGLLEFSGNLALVQEALGHQDPKTTRRYTKIRVEEIAAAVQAMNQASKDSMTNR